MTTITIDRALLERALKIIELSHVFSIPDCEVEIRAALAAHPSGPDWRDAPGTREAFEACANSFDAAVYLQAQHAWRAWQAACTWQREQDAKVCDDVVKRQSYGHAKSAAGDCADKIRSGG